MFVTTLSNRSDDAAIIDVLHEAIRFWMLKFGDKSARRLRHVVPVGWPVPVSWCYGERQQTRASFDATVGFTQMFYPAGNVGFRCRLKSAIYRFRVKRTIAPHNAMAERRRELEFKFPIDSLPKTK